MAIRVITINSKGITVSASTPSYIANASFDADGLKIVADGFGYSTAAALVVQQVNPILFDAFSFSESISYTWKYSRVYEDTSVFSDIASTKVNKGLLDTASITDSPSTATRKTVSDTFSMVEELSITRVFFLNFADVVVFSEDFDNSGEQQQWILFSELQSLIHAKRLEETLAISEVASKLISKVMADSTTISEVSARSFGMQPADTISITSAASLSLQDYFAEDYVIASGDQPYVSSYQTSI